MYRHRAGVLVLALLIVLYVIVMLALAQFVYLVT